MILSYRELEAQLLYKMAYNDHYRLVYNDPSKMAYNDHSRMDYNDPL